jgi:DNA-binding MarR family transcriptional regulator
MNLREQILAYLYKKDGSTAEEISRDLRVDKDEVEAVLNRLKSEGFVTKKIKGILSKKEAYFLTPSGLEEAKIAYEKVENKAKEIQKALEDGELDIALLPAEVIALLPLMTSISLIDFILLEDILAESSFDSDIS